MNTLPMSARRRGGCPRAWPILVLAVASLFGCGTAPELRQGRELVAAGRTQEALEVLEAGRRRAPDDLELRAAYVRQKDLAQMQWLVAADGAAQSRRFEEAGDLYDRVLKLDPGNHRARAGLESMRARRDHDQKVVRAESSIGEGRLAEAESVLRGVLAQDAMHGPARRALAKLRERQMNAELMPPSLKAAFQAPITLELRDTPLRNAFDVIGRTAQLNFVFDKDVRPDARVTLTVRASPVQDVIRLLLLTQQLDRKVLNDNSLLIYPATQAKQREYQELTARVFFLTNAEAKQAQGLLRTLAKTKEVHVDEKLNMVAIRDTAEAVRLAERLIDAIDVAEPEVMMEVEVLEVSHTRARDLGVQFPSEVRVEAQLPLSTRVPSGRIDTRDPSLVATIGNPALRIGLQATDTDVNLLANPRIRAKNREKAKILIGEKLPVFTSTAVQNAGVASSVSYLDVGLKLEVEPNVFLDDEVGIKVMLEVNTNLERIVSADGGTTAFRLGTRTAQTNLRLRDGETAVLAGLINDNDRDTLAKVPGLGDLPGIGRAFGNTTRTREKSEIVLLITPRVLRNLAPPTGEQLVLAAGTEAAVGALPIRIAPTPARGIGLSSSGGAAAPAGLAVAPAAAPASAAAPAVAPAVAPDAPAPANYTAQLKVPPGVSIGREFSVVVEVADSGTAQQGEAVLQFDPSLLGGTGRVSVALQAGGGSLVGSVTLRAQAAGAGSALVQVLGGSVRLPDGQQRPLTGGSATVRIGL